MSEEVYRDIGPLHMETQYEVLEIKDKINKRKSSFFFIVLLFFTPFRLNHLERKNDNQVSNLSIIQQMECSIDGFFVKLLQLS